MSQKTLPSISKIEFAPAAEVTILPKRIVAPGCKLSPIANWEKLNTCAPSSCITTPENTPNGLTYTTQITGQIMDNDDSELQHLLQSKYHSYLITDVYRTKYLVGVGKLPHPEIIFTPQNDAEPDGMRIVNFVITWIYTTPPIIIVPL